MYKFDNMCYDYMKGYIYKHLHRIHSLQSDENPVVGSSEKMELSLANEDDLIVVTDTQNPLKDKGNLYSFHCNNSESKGNNT